MQVHPKKTIGFCYVWWVSNSKEPLGFVWLLNIGLLIKYNITRVWIDYPEGISHSSRTTVIITTEPRHTNCTSVNCILFQRMMVVFKWETVLLLTPSTFHSLANNSHQSIIVFFVVQYLNWYICSAKTTLIKWWVKRREFVEELYQWWGRRRQAVEKLRWNVITWGRCM